MQKGVFPLPLVPKYIEIVICSSQISQFFHHCVWQEITICVLSALVNTNVLSPANWLA